MEKKEIRYLAILYSTKITEKVEDNLGKLYNITKQQLEVWHKLNLSWFDRVAVTNMNILPNFNFLFLHMPLHVPKKLLNSIQMILNRFIWSKKKTARIRARMMQQSVYDGGIGTPNIKVYYRAA